MSMHEWNTTMYGIEFPECAEGHEILAFINNHKDAFENEDWLPTTEEGAVEWASDFHDEEERVYGAVALISHVAKCPFIESECDQYGNHYVGMFAYTLCPWEVEGLNDKWRNVKREDIENEIRSLTEELIGYCPDFDYQTIWYFG